MRKSKAEKEIDRRIETTYYKYGQGVQISILDIPKIFRIGRDAILANQDLDAAIQGAIKKFQVNAATGW